MVMAGRGSALRVHARSTGGAGKGLHSFRFQLNLSSSVPRVTQLNPECVLDFLKLNSNVNECKPLGAGAGLGARVYDAACRTAPTAASTTVGQCRLHL
jgi:hypothetical protein